MAHQTLRLRAAHRELMRDPAMTQDGWQLWDNLVETTSWKTLFETLSACDNPAIRKACAHANNEALQLEMGPGNRETVSSEIRKRLAPYIRDGKLPTNSVLIGGPPCQAYSVVGRARNLGKSDYVAKEDHRHFLYREYLHVIAEFQPAVFVMENVKGILSSKVDDGHIFERILNDLRRPGLGDDALEYVLMPLAAPDSLADPVPEDFIIRAEDFGIPQARHRVIILGVRKDMHDRMQGFRGLAPSARVTVKQVLDDLPSLRPEVSRRGEGMDWRHALFQPLFDAAVNELRWQGNPSSEEVADLMVKVREYLRGRQHDPGSGSDRIRLPDSDRRKKLRVMSDWYRDRTTNLLTNHESRSHMPSDLVRYMFVSAFGVVNDASPSLGDFPKCLLPAHKNIDPTKVNESIFKDRFRVQVGNRHSMTVTSHIAKDGHAFIHYKPKQCRSLSVREAARLQTFPDTYVFLGNRTSQFTQVGNAVPPRLANQIADVVSNILVNVHLVNT